MRFSDGPAIYQIKVLGLLDPQWADWFDGMTLTYAEHETWLIGAVVDQAALHGLISKLRDLGLTILLVRRLDENNPL